MKMKRNYYILNDGRIRRKDNTVYVENENKKGHIPINDIESIYVFGEIDFNSKALNFLAQNNVTVHLFNYYGFYSSSFYPREYLLSGFSLVNQVEKYTDKYERIKIAKEFIDSASYNILKNLKYYNARRDDALLDAIEFIEKEREKLPQISEIDELMGTEGRIRDKYYSTFNKITKGQFKMGKRVKRPPNNPMNTLISFGNSLMYTTVLSEIYHTQLNPTVSYLHQPGERRFSLALDISEIFKPIIVDRIIFKLVNEKMIDEKHFTKELNFCHLNDKGKKIFLKQYDEKLNTTVKHKNLGRKVSYRRLVRLECYKLLKHINDIQEYQGFKMWW
jgi:CRISPR-associated protein Cas1